MLFLFPVAGVSVSHWFTAIFFLLGLISVWGLFKRNDHRPLQREERIWLCLCLGFFISFLISALINGWTPLQTRRLDVDARFLFIIPMYLLLRNHAGSGHWLLMGSLAASIFLVGQAYYDVAVLSLPRAQGFYSPNLLGPVAALMALYTLIAGQKYPRLRWVAPALVMAALAAVALSGSRGAYLGLLTMLVLWAWLTFRRRASHVAIIMALTMTLATLYYCSAGMQSRVHGAIDEVAQYLQEGPKGEVLSGSAVRFEMWKFSGLVFLDHPIAGIGSGNYQVVVKDYVARGLIHPDVAGHGHPHNAYAEVLMSRGGIGFAIFLALLFFPLYYFFKTRGLSPHTAVLGIMHISGFAVFSLTDASTFIKGNFVAIFLVYLATFLAWHVRSKEAHHGAPERSPDRQK
ncbi:MAG: hypothetical protein A2V90_00775 [Gammaproteobacteria bacterium RBG_16_57_12]|nr:MAG: hypothetical protein A2V90_00775 [Gammaproteobacteria bacterium RBG_16_57_12]